MSAETLRKAAQILRERGWTQGQPADENGRVCALGAIHVALFGTAMCINADVCRDVTLDVLPVLRRVPKEGDTSYSVALWNDRPGRTATEVIAALEAAAARLEAS